MGFLQTLNELFSQLPNSGFRKDAPATLTPDHFPSLVRFDSASKTDAASQLTDEQWFLIEGLFCGPRIEPAVVREF